MTDDVPAKDPVASELDGVDDMRSYVGHTAWKAAPTVRIDVDDRADLLTTTFYEGFPDVEIEPSTVLSVGFHRWRDEYLLTSLSLYGVARWEQPATGPDVDVARGLLGRSAGCAVSGLLGGGSSVFDLPVAEAGELLPAWRRFVDGYAGPPSPGCLDG